MPLEQRGQAENLYWAICHKIHELTQQLDFVPEELEGLEHMMSDSYFCNFSIFQSMPDSWAIKQLFPIVPIHRLEERPTHRAVVCDITCDSDGRIDRFIDRRDVKRTLMLHSFNDEPYYLGAFLLGAYQEILGDLHNLFGDTNAVHVGTDPAGRVTIQTIINGDTVREVLEYVEFDTNSLMHQMRSDVDQAVREQRLDDFQAAQLLRFYEQGLNGYTYLEDAVEERRLAHRSTFAPPRSITELRQAAGS
jgi:arginine decarboxylase